MSDGARTVHVAFELQFEECIGRVSKKGMFSGFPVTYSYTGVVMRLSCNRLDYETSITRHSQRNTGLSLSPPRLQVRQ